MPALAPITHFCQRFHSTPKAGPLAREIPDWMRSAAGMVEAVAGGDCRQNSARTAATRCRPRALAIDLDMALEQIADSQDVAIAIEPHARFEMFIGTEGQLDAPGRREKA